MKKFLVVGASGLMGTTFMDAVPNSLGVDEKALDITNRERVLRFFEEKGDSFDTVLNYAAFTNVDAAEKERGDEEGLVWRVNVEGPRNLAEASKKYGKFLIHISTDFVFKGTESEPGPYVEDAILPENPDGLGWYGWTKNRAEVALHEIDGEFAIVRTAYPFRSKDFEAKKDYAHGIISLYEEGKLYPMFTDQKLTVTYLEDQIDMLIKMAELAQPGVYHVVNPGVTTPHAFASYLLQKYTGNEVEVEKGSMEEFLMAPGRTPRPRLGGLDTTITEEKLDAKFRSWQEAVNDFVSSLK